MCNFMFYQFQKVEDYEMRSIMDSDDVLIDDEVHKYELLTVFGFYWRIMSQVGYLSLKFYYCTKLILLRMLITDLSHSHKFLGI